MGAKHSRDIIGRQLNTGRLLLSGSKRRTACPPKKANQSCPQHRLSSYRQAETPCVGHTTGGRIKLKLVDAPGVCRYSTWCADRPSRRARLRW